MGLYRDQILPRIQDRAMDRKENRPIRARVCSGLFGDVVDVGFGTGLNVPYYPAEITRVLAIEPSSLCLRIAEPRITRSTIPVVPTGRSGERLGIQSEQCDAVLSTWTLCTIPNVAAALGEMHRVLNQEVLFILSSMGALPTRERSARSAVSNR